MGEGRADPFLPWTQILVCDECGCESEDQAQGWTGHLAREEDDSITVVVFCPVCSVEV